VLEAVFYLAIGIFAIYLGRLAVFKKYQEKNSRLDGWEVTARLMKWLRKSIRRGPIKSKISGIGFLVMGTLFALIGVLGII
jgi:hypothetical protein